MMLKLLMLIGLLIGVLICFQIQSSSSSEGSFSDETTTEEEEEGDSDDNKSEHESTSVKVDDEVKQSETSELGQVQVETSLIVSFTFNLLGCLFDDKYL